MKKLLTRTVLVVSVGLAIQVSAQTISSRVATISPDTKLAGTAVIYSKSFLQERYMKVGRTIAYGLFIGGAYQNAVWRATGTYEGKAPVRQEANALEALLADFDVTGHVNGRLRARMAEARHFDIEFTDDPAIAQGIVGLAASEANSQEATQTVAGARDVVTAVKVTYGLGARAGREQLGFKKTYRPFVRLLCAIKRNGTGEPIWRGAVIAWSAKGYKGADVKAIPREELVDTFKSVTDDAITLLIRSLNGETLAPMGDLVDETSEDARF